MTKRNKYNPFKMWGSWVMGVLFVSYFNISYYGEKYWNMGWNKALSIHNIDSIQLTTPSFTELLPASILIFIVGFLIGWGINSLWRKFR